MKRRALVVHSHLRTVGGGHSVAAWTLEALRSTCDLTLLTWTPVDYEAINRFFGTSLTSADLKVQIVPAMLRRSLDAVPTPSALFKAGVLQRVCQRLSREGGFDLCISTDNEVDFGRRGVQYVHFPRAFLPRPQNEWRWYHVGSVVALYRAACQRIAGTSMARLRSNLTLANSDFIGGLIREAHGIDSVTLYPPVPGGFPQVAWEDREDAAVCIGRFSPEKRWEEAVELVRRLRAAGSTMRLTLVGHPDDRNYYEERLRLLARQHDWFSIVSAPPRSKMVEIVARHRYGLHPMVNEHFGIAPAELQSAGCITFVHRSGGPMEIVGRDDRLMFEDLDEAVRKLRAVLGSRQLQSELREQGAARAERFTSERFVAEMRRIVEEFR